MIPLGLILKQIANEPSYEWLPPEITSEEAIQQGHQVSLMGIDAYVHYMRMQHSKKINQQKKERTELALERMTITSKIFLWVMLIGTPLAFYYDEKFRRQVYFIGIVLLLFVSIATIFNFYNKRKEKQKMSDWAVFLLEKYSKSLVNKSR